MHWSRILCYARQSPKGMYMYLYLCALFIELEVGSKKVVRERNSRKCKRLTDPPFFREIEMCIFFFKNPRNECQRDCVIMYPQKSFLEILFPDLCVSYVLSQIPNKDIYRLLTHVLCNFTEKRATQQQFRHN